MSDGLTDGERYRIDRQAGCRTAVTKVTPLALQSVLEERARQEAKWGEQNHDPFIYLTILMEEVGELSQAALQLRYGGKAGAGLREEAVQVAAVALAIVECIDRDKWAWADGHPKDQPA